MHPKVWFVVSRPYRNKKNSRIEVLEKLCKHELPADLALVESELTRRQIDVSSVRSAQQKATLLLDVMHRGTDGAGPPVGEEPVQIRDTPRMLECPSADALATQALVTVNQLMFNEADKCTPAMEQMWHPRRKVKMHDVNTCCCTCHILCFDKS